MTVLTYDDEPTAWVLNVLRRAEALLETCKGCKETEHCYNDHPCPYCLENSAEAIRAALDEAVSGKRIVEWQWKWADGRLTYRMATRSERCLRQ